MTVIEGAGAEPPRLLDEAKAHRFRYLFERERFLAPTLLLPAVLYLAALVGFPLVLAFLYAFSNASTGNPSIHLDGLKTFESTINDPVFRTALRNTFIFTFVSQALVIILSVVLAYGLSTKFRGRWLVRFLIILPWTTPVALGAVAWLWMLDSIFSPFDWVLASVGLIQHGHHIVFLGQTNLAMGSIILMQTWRILPLATVILMAGLSAIPQDIKDAAEVDGAGFWRTMFGITLPLLTPVIAVALLFGIVFTFTDMAAVFIMTGGAPDNATQVLASWAFYKGINGGSLSEGAAIALFMFPVLLALAIAVLRLVNRVEVT